MYTQPDVAFSECLYSALQLLGREYYQTSFGHKFLVVTPLLVHTASGLAKRFVAPQHARKLRSLFTVTGYSALLFFLPVHYMIHREYPADPSPPIYEFGPSELDFEYVKYGLQQHPWRSWLLYAGILTSVAWHASEGMQIIWNTWLRGSLGSLKSNVKTRALTAAAVIAPVLSGLLVVSREPLMAFTSSITRFEGAFWKSFIYRI